MQLILAEVSNHYYFTPLIMATSNENELLSELYNFMLCQQAETQLLRNLLLGIISK